MLARLLDVIFMLELKAIIKKRKPFFRVIIYTLITSLTLLITSFFFEDHLEAYSFWPTIELILIACFISTSVFLIFTNWFPIIKNHKELGTITFEDETIIRTVYHKKESFSVGELSELKFNIFGHHGQDISSMPRIHIADGTGNFLTLSNSKFTNRKIEFYLESEHDLNTLTSLIEHYGTLTNVRNG